MTRIRKILPFLFCLLAGVSKLHAQQTSTSSVVQLYGIVMTSDSLRGLDGVSVSVKGKGRGTITNMQGVFSIAVVKGDVIEFTFVGYKAKTVTIPKNLDGNEYSVIQLMTSDTNYLPGTVIRAKPTKEQFDRDFVNTEVPADEYEIARQNTDEQKRAALMTSMPADGKEAVNYTLRQRANATYYTGQLPPQNIMNPMAWNEFIKSWKRGDFKKKK